MRFVERTLRVLAVASVVYGVRAATEGHQSASTDRNPALADVFGCLADRMSAAGEDRGPGGCYHLFLSFWNHVEEPPLHEKAVKERKKKRDERTAALLIGAAGAELILLLPALAAVIGKAVSLSFTSLLITALLAQTF